jgi:hypothetical protein
MTSSSRWRLHRCRVSIRICSNPTARRIGRGEQHELVK